MERGGNPEAPDSVRSRTPSLNLLACCLIRLLLLNLFFLLTQQEGWTPFQLVRKAGILDVLGPVMESIVRGQQNISELQSQ